jgi:hypothetical protein
MLGSIIDRWGIDSVGVLITGFISFLDRSFIFHQDIIRLSNWSDGTYMNDLIHSLLCARCSCKFHTVVLSIIVSLNSRKVSETPI